MDRMRATLDPSGVGGAASSLACLAVPMVRGGSPAIFWPIFVCFSAAYLVAGAIGWMVRPGNPTGPHSNLGSASTGGPCR